MEHRNGKNLEFACECVSAKGGYSDPWAAVAQNKLLPDGTKEKIINSVAAEPRTIAQISSLLKISQPTIFGHVNDMMASEILRESEEWEKKYPAERYYEPNFPVVDAQARSEFDEICKELSHKIADIFEQAGDRYEEAFRRTSLPTRGWEFKDITQYLYACAQRGARRLLEDRRLLMRPTPHKNGIDWTFWAEEPTD